MSSWTIYWFTRLDSIITLSSIVGILATIVGIILCVAYSVFKSDGDDDLAKTINPWRKVVLPMGIFFVLVALFVPSSKDFAAIYLIPKIVNNEKVNQIPDKALSILNQKLDKWIDEMVSKDKK